MNDQRIKELNELLAADVDDLEESHDTALFIELLDLCRRQVEAVPGSYLLNTHLWELQHNIYLRLCGGNIPLMAVEKDRWESLQQRKHTERDDDNNGEDE